MQRRTLLAAPFAALAASLASRTGPAFAQAFPVRPVRVIVPYPAGQGSDIFARRFSDQYQAQLGQPFVVENRVGAGGNIGAAGVARSEPDGYTLLWGTNATHAGNEFLYASLGYDPIKDFEPVVGVLRLGMVLAASKDSKIRTLADLVAAAKAKPGDVMIGLPSNTARVVAQMLTDKTGAQLRSVPYAGSGQALVGLLRNDVQVVIDTVTALLPQIRADKVTALAISTERRSQSLPDLPTFREAGATMSLDAWNALYAPKGTPAEIVRTLRAATLKALADPGLNAKLLEDGADPMGGSAEDLVALMKHDREIWGPTVKTLGIAVQ